MKRIIFVIAAAALLGQAANIFAQDSGEPSEQSVLDAARAEYRQDKAPRAASDTSVAAGTSVANADDAATRDHVPYTPVLVSFVPGVAYPFGYYDVSFAAGAIGTLARDVSGVEGAGVFTIARDVRGVQGAGVFNLARNALGIQDAGVFNIVDGDMKGLQGAGVFNIVHGKVTGIQGAGVFDIADEVHGFQSAGVFNMAGRVVGGQAAGVFNKADRVTGVQIGLVNVADYIDGVQIGLINIAGNGVGSIGATFEPASRYTYLHWQAGTPALYTVVGIGAPSKDWFTDYTGFVASFGLGSRTRLLGLNIDVDVSAEESVGKLPFRSMDCSRDDPGAWEGWAMIRPYPSVRLMAGLPLGRFLQIVGGVKADIDIDALGDRVPDDLKTGAGWQGKLFNEAFTVWPKWFLGVKT